MLFFGPAAALFKGGSGGVSLDLDGSTEFLATPSSSSVGGISGIWTFSFWYKATVSQPTGTKVFFRCAQTAGTAISGTEAIVLYNNTNNLIVEVFNTIAGSMSKKEYGSTYLDSTSWHHVVITYDRQSAISSNNPKVWIDNSVVTPTTETLGSGSHDSSTNNLIYECGALTAIPGTSYAGIRAHNLASWTSVLTAAQIAAVYNGKSSIDLTVNSGDYTASGNLSRYYKFGVTAANVGKEYKNGHDMTSATVNSADIANDSP